MKPDISLATKSGHFYLLTTLTGAHDTTVKSLYGNSGPRMGV